MLTIMNVVLSISPRSLVITCGLSCRQSSRFDCDPHSLRTISTSSALCVSSFPALTVELFHKRFYDALSQANLQHKPQPLKEFEHYCCQCLSSNEKNDDSKSTENILSTLDKLRIRCEAFLPTSGTARKIFDKLVNDISCWVLQLENRLRTIENAQRANTIAMQVHGAAYLYRCRIFMPKVYKAKLRGQVLYPLIYTQQDETEEKSQKNKKQFEKGLKYQVSEEG
jgi:hypothetical protein